MSTEVAARPASPKRKRGIWAGLLMTAVALAAIVALSKAEPTYAEKTAPVLVPGVRDQRVAGRNFAAKVGNVKVARSYLTQGVFSFSEPVRLRTSGVWLSVLAEVEALDKPGYVSAQLLTRDGLIYPASGDARPKIPGIQLDGRELAVGLPEKGAYFFEVPPDRLEGLRLQLFWGGLVPPDMDTLLDIDLGIDADRARELKAKAPAELDLRG